MVDGLLVVRYAGLRPRAHSGDRETGIDDLVAELRRLLLRVLGPGALASIDDGGADPDAFGTVARAIEDAAGNDPEFAREVTRVCDELARRMPQESRRPDPTLSCPQCGTRNDREEVFCGSCGTYLNWAGPPVLPDEATTAEPAQVEAPAAAAPPPAPDQHRSSPWSRRSKRRLELELGDAPTLEMPGRPPSPPSAAQAAIDNALSTYVQQGRLLFNPPKHMLQGRAERVTVAIAQHGGLDDQLRRLAPGLEHAPVYDIETTPFMAAELTGSAFTITSLQLGNAAEQLLRPTASWQYDVTPERRGTHPLQLRVAMRIPLPDHPDERVSLPVLERTVRVRVAPTYSGRRFVRTHWQWLAATAAGLGGAIAAWLKLFQG